MPAQKPVLRTSAWVVEESVAGNRRRAQSGKIIWSGLMPDSASDGAGPGNVWSFLPLIQRIGGDGFCKLFIDPVKGVVQTRAH